MSTETRDPFAPDLTPGARVEWRDGSGGDIATGILTEQVEDWGGGPRWEVDGITYPGRSLVLASAMYAPGGIRLFDNAREIAHAIRVVQYRRDERFLEWPYAIEVAQHLIKKEAEAGQ